MPPRALKSCVICGSSLANPRVALRTCESAACVLTYQQHLRAGRATCTECGRPLSPIDELHSARSCRDAQCQVYSRLNAGIADAERCRVCRMRLAPDCIAEGVCWDLDCRAIDAWRRQNELAQQRREQYLEQTRAATVLRDERGAAAGIAPADEYLVTVVSHFANPLGRLPAERREEFRANITVLVGQLAELLALNADPVEQPPLSGDNATSRLTTADGERLAGAVCAACRGYCCRQGDTHAYLHVDTLHRLLQRRAEMSIDQLADVYLSFLPEQSFVGSCVFHGANGCTLPREMRSDTCNRHLCAGQQDLAAAIERGATPRAFVAVSDGKQIVGGRFLNVEGDVGAEGDPGGDSRKSR